MKHPYTELKAEYEELIATMRITRQKEIDAAVKRILPNKDRYLSMNRLVNVPAVFIAGLHWRESTLDFNTNLANGDSLAAPTKNVPAGRPPLSDPPNDHFPVTFEYAGVDALVYDHMDDNTAPWTLSYLAWKAESYNGFGPRGHGIHPSYLFGGTQHYDEGPGGKYDRDSHWNPAMRDKQLGVIPLAVALMKADDSLAFDKVPATPAGLPKSPPPIEKPDGTPSSQDSDIGSAKWIQSTLNRVYKTNKFQSDNMPLVEDGNFGRRSREALRAFQKAYNIAVDGIVGPQTIAALQRASADATYSPDTKPPALITPDMLAVRIIAALKKRGDNILTDGTPNNVYVEGMDKDGRLNGNRPNQFNDANFLIEIAGGLVPKIVFAADATDEPGKYWTERPMNPGGAARIAFGQQDCWTPGTYHNMPAWIQDKPVSFYRDAYKNFRREGRLYSDMIGLLQHHGYNLPQDDLGRSSAGCLVRRRNTDHLEFMKLTTANGRKRLQTSVIAASEII